MIDSAFIQRYANKHFKLQYQKWIKKKQVYILKLTEHVKQSYDWNSLGYTQHGNIIK